MTKKNILKGGEPKNRIFEFKNTGRLVLVCLFWLCAWWLGSYVVNNSLILPSPANVVSSLLGLAQTGAFYLNVGATLIRCLVTLVISGILGIILGALAFRNKTLRLILSLPTGFFKIVPVMAMVIYIILIASSNWVSVIVGFLICFPIVYTNVLTGLEETPEEYIEMANVFNLKKKYVAKYIYFYSTIPHIKSAIKVTAGLSFKSVIAAEVLAVPRLSIGYQMMDAKYYLETSKLFSYVLVIIILSTILEKLVTKTMEYSLSNKSAHSKIKNGQKLCNSVAEASTDEIITKSIKKIFPVSKDENAPSEREDYNIVNIPNMTFKRGVTAVLGKSGIGKTTMARILSGLEKVYEGSVEIKSRLETDVHKEAEVLADSKYPKDKNMEYNLLEGIVSYLFQEDRLIPWLNIHDNLAISMNKADDDLIKEMADKLGIEDRLMSYPDELSGGMKHRVAIGRTFLSDKNVVILDEPFRALDDTTKNQVIDNLWEKETENKIVILISHNLEDVKNLSHKIYDLDNVN